MKILLALDQGTTSSRAIVFTPGGAAVAQAQQEFEQIFPQPGWVEHNPNEIWSSTAGTMAQALSEARVSPGDILAAGITNQRETTIVWDRRTGEPVYNAIVWQDRRTAAVCDKLRADGVEGTFQQKTGLLLDPYFSGTKLKWILDNVEGARARAERGELAFGTVDAWLVWNLTGGEHHLTDVSNASRTLLFNSHTGAWDDELLGILGVPREVLPEVRASSEIYGVMSQGAAAGAPLAAICGDQQAALFGQSCFVPGLTKVTYGTGCFLLQYTGGQAVPSRNRLLTTVAWRAGGPLEYALEGSVFIGGAVVQWLRDGLGLIRHSADIEPLARQVPDSGGVFLVPAFAGLGAPHWDPYARGLAIGLTRGTTAAHLARATLESIAFQVADLLEAMHRDSGIDLRELRVDGGAARNNLLMQFQADLLGAPVVRPATTELTALGAAWLAGLAVGAIKSRTEIASLWRADRSFEPSMPRDRAKELLARWGRAVERAQRWEQ